MAVGSAAVLLYRRYVVGRRSLRQRKRRGLADAPPQTVRQRRLTLVAPLYIVVLTFGSFWSDGWDAIKGAFKSVGNDIKDFVTSMVSDAIDLVMSGINLGLKGLSDLFDDLNKFAHGLADAAYAMIDGIRSLAWNLWSDAIATAKAYTNGAIAALGYIVQPVVDIWDKIYRLLDDTFHSAINWASANIYWPLWHLIDDGLRGLWNNVIVEIGREFWALLGSIPNDLQWALDRLHEIYHFVTVDLQAAYQLILKCWHFLVFVATHPFDWWVILIQDFIDKAPRWLINHIEANTPEYIGFLDDWISKALG